MRGTGGTGSFIKLDEVNGASRKRRIPTLNMGLMLMRRKGVSTQLISLAGCTAHMVWALARK